MIFRKARLTGLILGLASPALFAQNLTTQTWPQGTLLADFLDGGRVTTYHRGYVYLGGLSRTTVYDISDPTTPILVNEWDVGENGHRWWKVGDLFWREYSEPEIQGSGSKFANLSRLPEISPWTGSAPLDTNASGIHDFEIFPHLYLPWNDHAIVDQRTQNVVGRFDFASQRGVNALTRLRIGNLVFYVTESPNTGVSVFDVGDPSNVRLLDVLDDGVTQYTTFYAVWRNYIVLNIGDNTNSGGNNLVAIDYSDPTDLRVAFGLPTAQATSGRYIFFQDEFGFMTGGGRVTKINMETRTATDIDIMPPTIFPLFPDFQVIPLGHLLLISGSETGADRTTIYTHQDGLDTRPPSVGYHLPVDGAVNQPVSTAIGLVINETLDSPTLNDSNISLRPVLSGGSLGTAVPIDIVSSQHGVITVAPRSSLEINTTYELRVIGGGIRDVAGNGIEEYSFSFTTGTAGPSGGPGPGPGPGPSEPTDPPTISSVSFGSGIAVEGSTLTFSAQASHPTLPVEFNWQFGDGSGASGWSTANSSITHTFSQPGQYSVFLQTRVREPGGSYITNGQTTSVVVTASNPPPDMENRSTPIAIDESARVAWVANPDNHTVALLDLDTLSMRWEMPIFKRPENISLDSDGNAWVTAMESDEIHVLSRTGEKLRVIKLSRGSRPRAIVASPDGDEVFVSQFATGQLRRFDTSSFSETGVVNVGSTPQDLAISQDGTIYISQKISQDSGGRITVVNSNGSMSVTRVVGLPADTISADNGANARGLPNYVRGMALESDDETLWYVAKKDNIFRGPMRDGNSLRHDAMLRPLIGRVDASAGAEETDQRVDLDDTSMPSAVAISPLGAHAFVSIEGNNIVAALDIRTGLEIARAEVGLAPQGVAIDSATNRVFVKNLTTRTVTVLDGDSLMTSGTAELPVLATVSSVSNELMSSQQLVGKRIFYNAADTRMSLEGYLSCASCHLDGESDGRVWDGTGSGEGLRRTTSLLGRAGTGQGPVHWTGNFDEIQDFEINIRTQFGGTGFIPNFLFSADPLGRSNANLSSDLDALAAYVASLDAEPPSPFRNQDGTLTPEGERGRQVFQDQDCASCHTGSEFTDSELGLFHNVGTLRFTSGSRLGQPLTGLDTPTLLGLWQQNSYLHDGSVSTVRDVLTHFSAATHGGLDELSNSEIDDLEAYLLQIERSDVVGDNRPDAPDNVQVE